MSEIKELMARVQHSFAVMSQSKSWRKDEDSQTLKDIFAILSESDKKDNVNQNGLPTFEDVRGIFKYDSVAESDKPVETGEYRVDSINGSAVVLLGDECVLDITGVEPFQGSAIAHKVVGLLHTLSTRIRELLDDLKSLSASSEADCWLITEYKEGGKILTAKNESLTAELKASNRRFEGLEYSGNPRDWMLHLTAEVETQKAENERLREAIKITIENLGAYLAIHNMAGSLDVLIAIHNEAIAPVSPRGIDIKIEVDESLPPTTFELRSGTQVVRAVNVASPQGEETKDMKDD